MLKKFTVRNYRQFNEPLEFDLTASNYAFNPECTHNGLVKLALIYGENGTGKSNLGWAIFDLVSHLTDNKFKSWSYDCLNAYSESDYAEFEFHFVFFDIDKPANVIYKYQKTHGYPYGTLLYEQLTIDNEIIIEYHIGKDIISSLNGFQTLYDKSLNPEQNLSSIKYLYKNIKINDNDFKDIIFKKFFDFCNKITHFRGLPIETSGYSHIGYDNTANIGDKILKDNKLKDLENFLFDNGLNFNLIEIDNGGKRIGVLIGNKEFPLFDIASSGTRNLVIFYYWLQETINNQIPLLFIDEFDCSYHFALSEKIIEKLKALPNTQVILTTHNTNLLSNDFIRPDCGFIIDGKKIKSLNNLTEKELREVHNLEKLYQAGHFNNEQ
ncbi:Predicted ATP-binding protein involved in virulence [Moraxella lacunata]|uniref:Predicted ATP-binding protein involved in virulence n=1 Tax=Moraxella lacunata TaxID=477 RepID=A0A378TTI9_MORLA|nr:AAA family ATPase [Moraxella lacunata]STZ64047.1 Predicted ATP-binding protein involved in virulence [Moraxella lacunata]